jgi:hypothetical protein
MTPQQAVPWYRNKSFKLYVLASAVIVPLLGLHLWLGYEAEQQWVKLVVEIRDSGENVTLGELIPPKVEPALNFGALGPLHKTND